MAKVNKGRRNLDSRYQKPCQFPSCSSKVSKDAQPKKKHTKSPEKSEWDAATCSVCMEYPHNAVLLLCSSHNKGCRPYMCATSHRFSNCLEQYKKAYTKVTEMQHTNPSFTFGNEIVGVEAPELPCPLCRGKVKGWTVVEKARKYLNAKKRTCMEDDCNFTGSYRILRIHVKMEHPLSRPRAVDPVLEEKWKRLERERERSDVISTIVSSTPGAIVLGDYVIEGNPRGLYRHAGYDDDDVDDFFDDDLFSIGSFDRGSYMGYDSLEEDGFEIALPHGTRAAPGHGLHRLIFGSSRRRRRHREGNNGR